MSTGCQVYVVEKWSDLQDEETLYRHYDGHPKYMIPLIYRAWIWANDEYFEHRVGMARIVEESIYSRDPKGFKWAENHLLDWDMHYYYRLHCWFSFREDRPIWEIDVYERNCSFFENDLTLADFKLIESRQKIEDLVKKYNGAERINFSAIK